MSADSAHPNPAIARRLDAIYALHRTDIDLRLGGSPYAALLHDLGDPHLNLPPVVHVAGTNGKGSTIAFLRAMLEAAGYRVHVYTSPHLVVFNERIRLAGELIRDDALAALYDEVERVNAGRAITFFEFTTALAFLAFALCPADIVLLETGMGGRLDCTNVVPAPAVTAITKISFDHTEFLGETLPRIAAEKAGIMKAGVPCVIGAQSHAGDVMPVFENAAQALGVRLVNAPPLENKALSLAGLHQQENAGTACAIIDLLDGFTVDEAARAHGLSHTVWPGRLQKVENGPIAASLPAGWAIWFDAAHNDSGAAALGVQLARWKAKGKQVHLVAGLGADKDPQAFFGPLAGHYDTLTLVDLPQARRPQSAVELLEKTGLDAGMAPDVARATAQILRENAAGARNCVIIVAGSLYLYQTVTGTV